MHPVVSPCATRQDRVLNLNDCADSLPGTGSGLSAHPLDRKCLHVPELVPVLDEDVSESPSTTVK